MLYLLHLKQWWTSHLAYQDKSQWATSLVGWQTTKTSTFHQATSHAWLAVCSSSGVLVMVLSGTEPVTNQVRRMTDHTVGSITLEWWSWLCAENRVSDLHPERWEKSHDRTEPWEETRRGRWTGRAQPAGMKHNSLHYLVQGCLQRPSKRCEVMGVKQSWLAPLKARVGPLSGLGIRLAVWQLTADTA